MLRFKERLVQLIVRKTLCKQAKAEGEVTLTQCPPSFCSHVEA